MNQMANSFTLNCLHLNGKKRTTVPRKKGGSKFELNDESMTMDMIELLLNFESDLKHNIASNDEQISYESSFTLVQCESS